MEIKNILLTTDFSKEAQKAFPIAAQLGKKFDSRIHLVHVAEDMASFYLKSEGFGGSLTKSDFFSDVEDHLKKELGNPVLQGLDVKSYFLADTHLAEGLQKFEKENNIDLAVLSSHGHTGIHYALLGSCAEKIARSLTSPVLTCRAPENGSGSGVPSFNPKNILVPMDFSENSKSVIPTIRFLAREYDANFTFYFVVEPLYPVVGEVTGSVALNFYENILKETPKMIEKKFEDLKNKELSGVNANFEYTDGAPAFKVVQYAKEKNADLILMSTHGWTGMRHFFMGSVAETVVRKAPCSVLTVRSRMDK